MTVHESISLDNIRQGQGLLSISVENHSCSVKIECNKTDDYQHCYALETRNLIGRKKNHRKFPSFKLLKSCFDKISKLFISTLKEQTKHKL